MSFVSAPEWESWIVCWAGEDIAICTLTSADVVRHALVQRIINAYEKAEKKKEAQTQEQKRYQRKH